MSAADPGPEIDQVLRGQWDRGRAAWPTVALPLDDFARWLRDRVPADTAPAAFYRSAHGDGLYLACACALQTQGALQAFEAHFLPQVPSFLSRLSPPEALLQEVQQRLREKLFVATGAAPPKIAEYGGDGALGSWLRVVALREALSLLRKRVDQPLGEDQGDEGLMAVAQEPELAYMKARYQADFKQAFQDALRALTSEERNLLRLQLIDGLNIDQFAAMYKVHRATAARWLHAIREKIFEETRRLLEQRLQLRAGELDSLIRVVRSQLDVSIARILKED